MKKNVRNILIIGIICVVVLVGALIVDKVLSKSYFSEIKYDALMEKIENKDDIVLCISQTTCSHCASYKPKLEDVANEEKIEIYYIDVDLLSEEEANELKSVISYSSTPATLFIVDGEEKTAATRINGDASKDKIRKKLKSNGFID